MATTHAIVATGLAIKGLLEAALPRAEFATAEIALYRPEDFDDPMAEGISLHLYRVTVAGGTVSRGTRVDLLTGRRFLPSLLVDLHYLLTPWAATAGRQHALLGWAMRALDDVPTLGSGLLNHFGPDAATFRQEEGVQLMPEPLSLADMGSVWEAFKPNVQLSVGYVARPVAIDSEVEQFEGPIVQTRAFGMGRVVAR